MGDLNGFLYRPKPRILTMRAAKCSSNVSTRGVLQIPMKFSWIIYKRRVSLVHFYVQIGICMGRFVMVFAVFGWVTFSGGGPENLV